MSYVSENFPAYETDIVPSRSKVIVSVPSIGIMESSHAIRKNTALSPSNKPIFLWAKRIKLRIYIGVVMIFIVSSLLKPIRTWPQGARYGIPQTNSFAFGERRFGAIGFRHILAENACVHVQHDHRCLG